MDLRHRVRTLSPADGAFLGYVFALGTIGMTRLPERFQRFSLVAVEREDFERRERSDRSQIPGADATEAKPRQALPALS